MKKVISLLLCAALTFACAAALVIVSLATYKKAPTRFLDPYEEERKQKAQQA